MARGENIFKRKDGRWEARYIKGHDLSGAIIYGFCYGKTYREAKEKAMKCRLLTAAGSGFSVGRFKLGYYCDQWLGQSVSRVKESTYAKYRTIINNHIRPYIGECLPQALSTEIIGDFTSHLSEDKHLSPKTIKDILIVLRAVINFANKQISGGYVKAEITYPKDVKKEMRVLSRSEQERFIDHLLSNTDRCKFGILLAMLTGMRIGEVCALKWKNISLSERTITINSTMQRLADTAGEGYSKPRLVITPPKSDQSVRVIPMTDKIYALCLSFAENDNDAFLLTGTRKPMEPRTLQYRLKKYTTACGLEGVHFHTLRHTFATRCVEVGFEIKSLSEILGHSSVKITLDRYVHSSLELKRSNMDKLASVGL
ncbi:MAG: site-specific integrase [Christensenellaceae bacterium]|nr:site-specific integrase [Christensenellaceae bacterium]